MDATKTTDREIVTAREALTRVGLGGLDLGPRADVRVYWTGYPTPMACGHYDNNRRVSRHSCGGDVLFSWSRIAGEPVGELHVVINPESTHDRNGSYSPHGSTLTVSWSGY